MKPLNKREVVVSIKNVHPNTRDDDAIRYLNLFGKVTSSKVIYGVFGEGPFRGLKNGIRHYKMNLRPDSKLGTYHVLNGQKVIIKYPGQMQTCGRCHQTSKTCKGKCIARKCQEAGGDKVDFVQYILSLWRHIGYSPDQMPPSDINEAEEEEIVTQEGGNFTPPKVKDDVKNVFTGICIKRISQETDHCEVVELLKIEGLPEEYVKEIDFKENGSVVVKNLPHNICQQLIKTIHRRTMFGKRVFCNGLVTLTPEKKDNEEPHSSSAQSTPPPSVQITMETSNISKPTETSPTTPVTFTQLGSNSDIDLFVEENQERLDRE